MRRADYEKIINSKKAPMEQELTMMTGKKIKIKDTQLFNIAANSTWDLGINPNKKILGSIKIKKKKLLWEV